MRANIITNKTVNRVSAPGYFVIQKALYFVILRQLAQVRGYKQRDYITICTTNLGLSNRWMGKNPSDASLFCHPSWFMDLSLWFSRGALLEKCPYSAVFTPWQNTLTVGDKIDVSLYWQNSRSLTTENQIQDCNNLINFRAADMEQIVTKALQCVTTL